MKPIRFMVDALHNNIVFYLEGESLKMDCPDDVKSNPELMQLIRKHSEALRQYLVNGFDCVRDGITFKEKKELIAASMRRHPQS